MESREDFAIKSVYTCANCGDRKPLLMHSQHDLIFMDCEECDDQREFTRVDATVTELAILEIQEILKRTARVPRVT